MDRFCGRIGLEPNINPLDFGVMMSYPVSESDVSALVEN